MAVAKEQIRQIISENNLSSVADVYALLKDSFKDILQKEGIIPARKRSPARFEETERIYVKTWNAGELYGGFPQWLCVPHKEISVMECCTVGYYSSQNCI